MERNASTAQTSSANRLDLDQFDADVTWGPVISSHSALHVEEFAFSTICLRHILRAWPQEFADNSRITLLNNCDLWNSSPFRQTSATGRTPFELSRKRVENRWLSPGTQLEKKKHGFFRRTVLPNLGFIRAHLGRTTDHWLPDVTADGRAVQGYNCFANRRKYEIKQDRNGFENKKRER